MSGFQISSPHVSKLACGPHVSRFMDCLCHSYPDYWINWDAFVYLPFIDTQGPLYKTFHYKTV